MSTNRFARLPYMKAVPFADGPRRSLADTPAEAQERRIDRPPAVYSNRSPYGFAQPGAGDDPNYNSVGNNTNWKL